MFNDFPRIALIGDTGEGKTTAMTALAVMYYQQGKKIFSNYELSGVKWQYLDPSDIAELMFQDDSPLYNCVILTDEAHMDLGKFKAFAKSVQDIGDFATQTRKRKIIWIYTTQIFNNLVKTIRDLTTNIIYCEKIQPDIFKLEIYNRKIANNGYIKTIFLNGAPFYKYFDTEQIIKKTIKNTPSEKKS